MDCHTARFKKHHRSLAHWLQTKALTVIWSFDNDCYNNFHFFAQDNACLHSSNLNTWLDDHWLQNLDFHLCWLFLLHKKLGKRNPNVNSSVGTIWFTYKASHSTFNKQHENISRARNWSWMCRNFVFVLFINHMHDPKLVSIWRHTVFECHVTLMMAICTHVYFCKQCIFAHNSWWKWTSSEYW